MDEISPNQLEEVTPSGTFAPQNSSMVKVRLDTNAVQAKPGSVVAYQGDVRFVVGRDLGETFQIAFEGPGCVLIQPFEGPKVPPHTHAGRG